MFFFHYARLNDNTPQINCIFQPTVSLRIMLRQGKYYVEGLLRNRKERTWVLEETHVVGGRKHRGRQIIP